MKNLGDRCTMAVEVTFRSLWDTFTALSRKSAPMVSTDDV